MYSKLAHESNYQTIVRKSSDIQYIVIHYTANDGDTARNNLNYYHENVVKASAHFFVDDKEVCCSVPWYFRAWHCGGKKYPYGQGGSMFGLCTNANSIGIELCSRKTEKGIYYFTDSVLERAAEFTAQQMKNYGLSIDRVIRHYDVTGKYCPAPMVDSFAWKEFKEKVMEYYHGKRGETMTYYEKLEDIPKGVKRDTIKKLVDRGIIKGNLNGDLHLSDDMVRILVFNDRAGLYN